MCNVGEGGKDKKEIYVSDKGEVKEGSKWSIMQQIETNQIRLKYDKTHKKKRKY